MKDSLSEPPSETLKQKPAEALKTRLREWPGMVKKWLKKLRGRVTEEPRGVLEEEARAQGDEMGLVDDRSGEPSRIILGDEDSLIAESYETGRVGETVCFGYRQQVIRIPEERVSPDASFPCAHTDLQPDAMKGFAIQVVDSTQSSDPADYMIATDKSGRQLFSESNYDADFDGRAITTIMVKSTGMPKAVRQRWEEYEGAEEPFFFAKKQIAGDARTGLLGKDEFMGLALKEDQRLDAENSLRLHNVGVKVRIPLSGWQVKELCVAGQWRDVEWFKTQGYEGNELFQSAWGMTCPLRLEDVNSTLTQAVVDNVDPQMLDPMLLEFVRLASKDKTLPYQELVARWGEVTGDLNQEQRFAMWTDFGIALCKTMGNNFEALQSAGLVHGNIHDQNVTFFGELCDCSTVKDGLIKSGGAQKIGDDVDSFADGMRVFADKLLRMQGVDVQNDQLKVTEMLKNVFYPRVREAWKGYEDWIKINIGNLTENPATRARYRAECVIEAIEPEMIEDEVTDRILRRAGGEGRYRVYG